MENSEGFDEFMYELGVNVFTRKIANNLYPLQEIRMEDDQMCIDTFTSFKNTRTKFPLGTAWEEHEFSEDGSTMTLRLIIPAKPEIVCARVYKRVVPGAEGESEEKAEAAEENVAQW